jgi:hypothetical protein
MILEEDLLTAGSDARLFSNLILKLGHLLLGIDVDVKDGAHCRMEDKDNTFTGDVLDGLKELFKLHHSFWITLEQTGK